MEYDFEVLERLCKFHQTKVLGLSPERVSTKHVVKDEIKFKYKEFKTDGYYVNIIHEDVRSMYGYIQHHRRYVGLSLTPLSEGGKVILSIEKSDSGEGEITEHKVVLNGSNVIRYQNNGVQLTVNKFLTKDKFFENIIMSDINLEYKYFELAMNLKQKLQSQNKKIIFKFNEVDNEILKRTIL